MKMKLSTVLSTGFIFLCAAGEAQTASVQWAANGHYYDAISFPSGITWDDARIFAENSTYLGQDGYLATVTSMEENSFIINNLGGPSALNGYFLGGFQPEGSPEPTGNWQWVTGEIWSFSNWAYVEPNDRFGGDGIIPQPHKEGWNEEVLQFWGNNGTWNDMEQTAFWGGLIVEYGSVPSVPLPSALWLFGSGLFGLLAVRRRLKD
jgi:hypothetical protein